MRNKVAFIICYFGKLPNYYPLWLESCKKNPDFTWFLFTDNKEEERYPENVKRIEITFDALENLIREKTDINLGTKNPYKLCDFRPLYGAIFSDYIKDFTHWGHCDTDLIWGNLKQFVTDELLGNYDRVYIHGHLSIYKNTQEVNQYYKRKYTGIDYTEILTSKEHFGFDEKKGITLLYKDNDLSQYEHIDYADTNFYKFDFELHGCSNYPRQYFMYDEGHVYRYNGCGRQVDEFAYIHLQKRKMYIDFSMGGIPSKYLILNDGFYIEKKEISGIKYFYKKIKFSATAHYKSIRSKIRWNLAWKIKWLKCRRKNMQ